MSPGDGRLIVRYQQNHQGIPVMGGELIVNTNENGDLYSINGEISADLSLSTQPTIDPEQARQSALQAIAKWYQKTLTDFIVSEPELWIFDESLLRTSTRPVELVWRMEVTSLDKSMPVRELVLVNAQRGNISLHFNQVDTAWAASSNPRTNQAPEYNPNNRRIPSSICRGCCKYIYGWQQHCFAWYIPLRPNYTELYRRKQPARRQSAPVCHWHI